MQFSTFINFQVAVKEEQKWEGKGGVQKYQTYTNYHREKERVFASAPKYMRG